MRGFRQRPVRLRHRRFIEKQMMLNFSRFVSCVWCWCSSTRSRSTTRVAVVLLRTSTSRASVLQAPPECLPGVHAASPSFHVVGSNPPPGSHPKRRRKLSGKCNISSISNFYLPRQPRQIIQAGSGPSIPPIAFQLDRLLNYFEKPELSFEPLQNPGILSRTL